MVYDYIVVGAGSAGCAVAARLSEDPRRRVMLVEAGGAKANLQVSTPGLASTLWRTKYDWGFRTAPQSHMGGREGYWPRGKVLGGTSCLNYMIYMRGHRADYDAWREMGCEGWGYDDVLPYFKRSEDNVLGEGPYHGAGGPVRAAPVEEPSEICQRLAAAGSEVCDVPLVDDLNTPEREGFGPLQLTTRDSRRCSAAVAFLEPAMDRPNLTVVTEALVERVLVEGGRAKGIRYRRNGRSTDAHAEAEVVLCAGSIGSPHILLLSGIGPAEDLETVGVHVIHDLPGVGKNLQDHLYAVVGYEVTSKTAATVNLFNMLGWLGRYLVTHRGPLTSTGCEYGGFVRTHSEATIPNLQFHLLATVPPTAALDEINYEPRGRGCSILPTLIYPKSVGELRLKTYDPGVPPWIDPHYLEEEEDMETLLRGTQIAHEMAQSSAVRGHLGKPLSPAGQFSATDSEIRQAIRDRAATIFHPIGTCKMGVDSMAVVDPELRVRGIERLRVADASIMPRIPGGNTNAPATMIAEKAVDLLRQGRPRPQSHGSVQRVRDTD